jgi:hypothetical protein
MPVALGPGKRVLVSDVVEMDPEQVIESAMGLKKCRMQKAYPAHAKTLLPEMYAGWEVADSPLGSPMLKIRPVQSLKQLL